MHGSVRALPKFGEYNSGIFHSKIGPIGSVIQLIFGNLWLAKALTRTSTSSKCWLRPRSWLPRVP